MSYAEQYLRAKEKGSVQDISATIFKFEKPGEQLLGELVGFGKINIEIEGKMSEVTKYTIMTDTGQVTCILGYSGDEAIKQANIANGDGLFIEYQGKKQIARDRQVNLFKIEKFKVEDDKPF